jgi:hypothetical protein
MRQASQYALDQVLDGYRKGFCDKAKTISRIGQIRRDLSDVEAVELYMILTNLYEASDRVRRQAGGFVVDEAELVVSCLAEFYPPERLTELVFSQLQTGDEQRIEKWAQVIVPEFQWSLTRCAQRFSEEALNQIKALITLVRNTVPPYSSTVLFAMDSLERTVEYIEFQRFEASLPGEAADVRTTDGSLEDPLVAGLDPTVAGAIKRAEDHLRSRDEFSAKSAADLIRSAMEEAHRVIVKQLATIKGKPYDGGEKEGARRHYMRSVDFISEPEEKFFSAIYSLLSQEGSHRLIAPRETTLLLHQTVSNYIRLLAERVSREVRP